MATDTGCACRRSLDDRPPTERERGWISRGSAGALRRYAGGYGSAMRAVGANGGGEYDLDLNSDLTISRAEDCSRESDPSTARSLPHSLSCQFHGPERRRL